jgi:glycosyltransferase involved in cell wall biosynthesis
MTSAAPTISLIIAVRNGAKTLQRCLDSIAEQYYQRVQVIVMDGASTDGTQRILERNADRIDYWESKPDRGVCHAWNKALDHTTGDWVCFLGADDRFASPDALRRMAETLKEAAPRYSVVYASVHVIDDRDEIVQVAGEPWGDVKGRFRHEMAIPHQGTMHHHSLFERHGRFDERYQICGDYEFLLRELLDHDPKFVPGLVLVDMATGGLSNDPSGSPTMVREFHRARYTHGLESSPEWRSFRVVRAGIRGWITRTFGPRVADAAGDVYRFVARGSRGRGPR